MRVAFTIAIIVLAFTFARSQDFHVSPAYYPIKTEIVPKWKPVELTWADYDGYDPDYGSALPSFWQKNKKGFAIMGIQMASIILDATGDAVYDMGKESGNDSQMTWGHTLQASAIGSAMLLIPMIDWERPIGDGVKMAISYVAMRYAIFDLTYNLTRGIDPLYADGIKADMPPAGRAFTQTIFFGFSIAVNFSEF